MTILPTASHCLAIPRRLVTTSPQPRHAGASLPLASAWWSWTAPTDGQVTVSTLGSDFDTTLAAYTGTSLENLTEVAANDDFQGVVTSQISFAASRGTDYAIAVDGHSLNEGNIELRVNFVSSTTWLPGVLGVLLDD